MNSVRVTAPARLHLGMFDLSGSLGRRFGGIGVAIAQPSVIIAARPADDVTANGPDAARAVQFARRYLQSQGINQGAELQIEQAIPAHVGLGSGTKLGLSVARALAALFDQPDDPYVLAQAVGRGARSAIGLWTFAEGGFVVEGGQRPDESTPAPLLLRRPMPDDWRCVLVIPEAEAGLSGVDEATAFDQLAPTADQAAQIAHVVLMALLPALAEGDLAEFGAALTRVQQLVGDCFSEVQGGRFGNPRSAEMIDALLGWGAAGAGQSSWGPAVYGLAADEQQGRRLAAQAEQLLAGRGTVQLVGFDNRGVRLQRNYEL